MLRLGQWIDFSATLVLGLHIYQVLQRQDDLLNYECSARAEGQQKTKFRCFAY